MRKVIGGVTYNSDTSTAVARSSWQDDTDREVESILYQTQGGAFFVQHDTSWMVRRNSTWEERHKTDFDPMSHEEAHHWVLTFGNVTLLSDAFPEPPEAAAETTAAATIYLRVPIALKARIEAAAKVVDQSVNIWAMRCLENCAAGQSAAGPSAAEALRGVSHVDLSALGNAPRLR